MYKLDLTHHLVLLLGANRGVWRHIDFIYAKKEVEETSVSKIIWNSIKTY